MHVVRNLRKSLIRLGPGVTLGAGEEREVSDELVARLKSKPGTAAWFGRFIELDPKPRVIPRPQPKPPTALEVEVRRKVDLLLSGALGRSPKVQENTPALAAAQDIAELRVPEAVALIEATSDEETLLGWAEDPRKGVQEAIVARLAELDEAARTTTVTTAEGGAGEE